MPATKYLLLVIDLLNDYFRPPAPLAAQRDSLVASVNRLAAAFRQAKQPIAWVRQEFAPDLSDAFLRSRRENHRVTIAGTDPTACSTTASAMRGMRVASSSELAAVRTWVSPGCPGSAAVTRTSRL